MALIIGSKQVDLTASANSAEYSMLSAKENDVSYIAVSVNNGSITAVAGNNGGTYTERVNTNGGDRLQVYECVHGVIPDTLLIFTTSASTPELLVGEILIDEADTTTPTDVVNAQTVNSLTPICPSVTPTAANSLILTFGCSGGGHNMLCEEGMSQEIMIEGTGGLAIASTYHLTADATPTYRFYIASSANRNSPCATIAVKDRGNGIIKGFHDMSVKSHTLLHLMGESLRSGDIAPSTSHNPVVVEGLVSVSNDAYTQSQLVLYNQINSVGDFHRLGIQTLRLDQTLSADTNKLNIIAIDLTSKDLSDVILITTTSAQKATITGKDKLGVICGLSDGTNIRFFQIGSTDTTPAVNKGIFPTLIKPDDLTFALDEKGTVNLNAVTSFIVGHELTGTNSAVYPAPLAEMGELCLVGGSASVPVTFSDTYEFAVKSLLRVALSQGGVSENQVFLAHNLRIGGSKPVYFVGSNQSVDSPAEYSKEKGILNFKIPSASLTCSVDATDGSHIDLSNCTINRGNLQYFALKSTSSNALNSFYNFKNCNVLNATLELSLIPDLVIDSMAFVGCTEVSFSTLADLSGGNSFTSCISPVQITISNQTDFHKLDNCSFRDNNIAIRITGDQTGTWADPNITFNGNETDIEYTGTTNFEIGSLTAINVLNSGTGILSVNLPQPTLTITLSESNCEIRLYEADGLGINMGTEIDGVESFAGTEYTYQHNGSVNDIYIQVILLDYEEVTLPFQLNGTNQFINIDLQLETNN